MLEKIVPQNRAMLSEVIANNTDLGHFQIAKIIKDRHVKVNKVRVGVDCYVDTNDEIYVYIKDKEKDRIEIVYSDNNLLVAVKPAGIEVEGKDSLTEKLCNQLEEAKPVAVHRLDRNTFGLVIFALNSAAEKELLKVFAQREIDKAYMAIVSGNPANNATLRAFLFKDAKKSQVYISKVQKQGYLPIETQYKFLKKKGDLSLLEIKLVTGRTHQVRAHLASEKLPVLGDGKYGINQINRRYRVKQQALVCYKITFHFDKQSPLHYLDGKVVKYDVDLFELVKF